MGQPLHPHCGVFRRTPRLAELPLWRHLHPSALLALPVVHALTLTKPHPHASARGQKRLQNPGYFHLPETVLSWRLWGALLVLAHVSTAKVWIHLLDSWTLCCPLSPQPLLLVSLSYWGFLSLDPFMWCNVEHCLTRMLLSITWGRFAAGRAGRQEAAFLLEQNGQSMGAICWSGATSGSSLLLAWHTSMGFVGMGHIRVWGNRPKFVQTLTEGQVKLEILSQDLNLNF